MKKIIFEKISYLIFYKLSMKKKFFSMKKKSTKKIIDQNGIPLIYLHDGHKRAKSVSPSIALRVYYSPMVAYSVIRKTTTNNTLVIFWRL